jgi:uracil-DNA glycosylase
LKDTAQIKRYCSYYGHHSVDGKKFADDQGRCFRYYLNIKSRKSRSYIHYLDKMREAVRRRIDDGLAYDPKRPAERIKSH